MKRMVTRQTPLTPVKSGSSGVMVTSILQITLLMTL